MAMSAPDIRTTASVHAPNADHRRFEFSERAGSASGAIGATWADIVGRPSRSERSDLTDRRTRTIRVGVGRVILIVAFLTLMVAFLARGDFFVRADLFGRIVVFLRFETSGTLEGAIQVPERLRGASPVNDGLSAG